MPIDPSIPLQAQPLKLETPMNQLAMAGEMMKIGEYKQASDERNFLRNRMTQPFDIANPEHRQEVLAGAPTVGGKWLADTASMQKNLYQGEKVREEIDTSRFDKAINHTINEPNAEAAAKTIMKGMADKSVPLDKGQAMLEELKTTPFAAWTTKTLKTLVGAREQFVQDQTNKRSQATLNQAAQFHKESDIVGTLTPESITNAAARYNIDGTLPPLGMGKAGANMRSQILNEAAVQAKGSGVSPEDQRIAQIGNAANKSSLTQLSKSEAMVGAFEKNFVRNADLALKQSTVVDNTGIPIVNSWINAGKRSVTGDPKLSAYDAAIKATVNEYAKIISGSMGNTATALGEIKKVNELLASAQTPEQVNAVINMMKQETQNRMTGFKEQKAELTSGMKGKKNTSTSSSPSNTPALPSGYVVD